MILKKRSIRSATLAVALLTCYIGSFAQNNSKSTNQTDFLEKAPLNLIDIGNQKLAVRHYKGEGIPLVFIHGTLEDHSSWTDVASILTQTIPNPIITYDLRGHSCSKLEIMEQGTIFQDATDAVNLVKALGYDSAIFVGHSYGANISIKIAIQYPQFANSIILYEPPVFGLLKEKEIYHPGLAQATQLFSTSMDMIAKGQVENGIKIFIENMAFGPGSWTEQLDFHHQQIMLINYETYIDQAKDNTRLNLNVRKLNEYNGSITLLSGTHSLMHFQACIKELSLILDDENSHIIKGAGHAGVFTHPNIVANSIVNSLSL